MKHVSIIHGPKPAGSEKSHIFAYVLTCVEALRVPAFLLRGNNHPEIDVCYSHIFSEAYYMYVNVLHAFKHGGNVVMQIPLF